MRSMSQNVRATPRTTAGNTQNPAKRSFYACGGDGTLYEVVNGAYGYPNCEVAVIPLGSGNDFVRLFGTKEQFCNVEAQVTGIPVELDVIKCGDKIAINQCSMGMDAEVCAKQSYFKKMPLMTGETAYVAAALQALCKKIGHEFTITIDDGEPIKQDVLLWRRGEFPLVRRRLQGGSARMAG